MALTATEKQTIAKMFRSTPSLVAAHITSLGAAVTADLEADIRAELTRWGTASLVFESIEPKEANFGARIEAEAEKNDIRANVASLLEWPYTAASAGMGSLQIG